MVTKIPGLEYDEAKLIEICQRWHIRELKLFGSQARGDARPDSDVDLMVSYLEGLEPETFTAYLDLKDALEGLFGRPVDLLSDQPIRNPFRRRSIEHDLMSIYAA